MADSADDQRLDEACHMLHESMGNQYLNGKPLLVLANKQDCNPAFQPAEVAQRLKLEHLALGAYSVRGTSAYTRNRGSLVDAMKWLVHVVEENEVELRQRIGNEQEEQRIRENKAREERKRRIQERHQHEEQVPVHESERNARINESMQFNTADEAKDFEESSGEHAHNNPEGKREIIKGHETNPQE